MKKILFFCTLLIGFLVVGCGQTTDNTDNNNTNVDNNENNTTLTKTITYDFNDAASNFGSGITDIPAGDEEKYNLNFTHEQVPLDVTSPTRGLMVSMNNVGKTAFIYIRKTLNDTDGLKPDTEYDIKYDFEVISNAGNTEKGNKVYVKTGVMNTLPLPEEKDGNMAFRGNKGTGANDGTDLKKVGDLSTASDTKYETKKFNYETKIKSSPQGELFLVIGLDSEYTGETKAFIDNINFHINEIKG